MPSRYILESLFGERPQALLDHVPHCREIGMQAVRAGPGEVVLRIPYAEHLVGDVSRGVVFGGVITTLLDHAGGAAVMCSLSELVSVATIDLRIDYMRPAVPGCDLIGAARCYRRTRDVAFVRGAAYHDDPDDPFATFLSTYMLGANRQPPGVLETLSEGGLGRGGSGRP